MNTSESATSRRKWLAAIGIVALGALAFVNSFSGPFLFDDLEIPENLAIRHLLPPWPAMFAPRNVSRPLVGLSLAVNYAIGRLDTFSYHAFNLAVHLLAALTLFGIVRRTLTSSRLKDKFGSHATALAFAVAAIWMVHPLQTQSVTYIIQRGESMMGLFFLLTLYAVIRAAESSRRVGWYITAVFFCAAGMLCKQVMVTAPLVVLIYDSLFLSESVRDALTQRWRLYAGLAATWGVLGATVAAAPVNLTAGFAVKSISPLHYFVSEFGVIVHYLRLAFWPDALCLDYGWPPASSASEIVPFGVLLLVIAVASFAALLRRRPVGFLGAWFFIILGVTSSFMPFTDLAYEHRMYLPLAAVAAFVVLGGFVVYRGALDAFKVPASESRASRLAILVLFTLVLAVLSVRTLRRNIDYKNPLLMWSDVVNKRPDNSRGHTNLGSFLAAQGRFDEAFDQFREAVRCDPNSASAHSNLGVALVKFGRVEEGKAEMFEALRLRPGYSYPHFGLAKAFASEGNFVEAVAHFRVTVDADPSHLVAYYNMAQALQRMGKTSEAIEAYRKALELDPDWPEALRSLALVLATCDDASLRNTDEAEKLATRAVELTNRHDARALDVLGAIYAETGRLSEAVDVAQTAVELAQSGPDTELTGAISARLARYRQQSGTVVRQ